MHGAGSRTHCGGHRRRRDACGVDRAGGAVIERDRLLQELACAAEVEVRLRPTPPSVPGFELATLALPAGPLGGDFYDFALPQPGVLSLTIADVMGSGTAAALLVVDVRAHLHALARRSEGPADGARELARLLERDLARTESFVTLFDAHVDLEDGRVRYVDAGHGCALLLRAHGPAERLEDGCPPLGIADAESFRNGTFALEGGDTLVLFTDGLFEACADLRSDPLRLAVPLEGACGAAQVVARIEALAGGGPRRDDITVVALSAAA